MVYDVLFARHVRPWLKSRFGESMFLWWGDAAEAMGLNVETDYATALRVLRDGVGPHGEKLGIPATCTCDDPDCAILRANPPVSYLLKFYPHKTIVRFAANPATRERVWEAHWLAARAAVMALENTSKLKLVGAEATIYREPMEGSGQRKKLPVLFSESVFVASGYDGVEWRSLGTLHDLDRVLPLLWGTVAFYQRRLGEEVESRLLGVEVAYETSPPNDLPIAVVKS